MALIQADSLRVQVSAEGMATLVIDLPAPSVNVFNRLVLEQLEPCFNRLDEDWTINFLLIRSGNPLASSPAAIFMS